MAGSARAPGTVAAWLCALAAALAALAWAPAAHAITLPSGFDDQLVANVGAPTAIAFTPDARILVTSQPGALRVVQNGVLQSPAAIDLSSSICNNSERGLLGVAVDPSFAINRYIYLYYTHKTSGSCPTNSSSTPTSPGSPVNRVSRFILSDANTVSAASEQVLIDNIPSPAGNHNAGDLGFGKDGNLYISTGDGGCDWQGNSGCAGSNDASRDQFVLIGKVLRITPNGDIPDDNPFQGADADRCNVIGQTTAGRRCRETYAWGLRNPFRLAFDPDASGTSVYINDVGQGTWEEVDQALPGADYGWNVREGHCATGSTSNCGPPPAGMTNPIFDYDHSAGCASITGGAFVPDGLWPSQYDASYLFGDYVCGRIFALDPGPGSGFTSTQFASSAGAVVGLAFGPFGSGQALYYLEYGGGQVRRIAYTGTGNRSPIARIQASPTSGPVPLTVNFNGSTSSDRDNDPLTYQWDFGDGSPLATGVSQSHTYQSAGTFTARLTVSDGRGGSGNATVRIDPGNTPPSPTIGSPTAGQLFRVGEQITLTGSATDAQDGQLPSSSLTWHVVKHHSTHTHPFLAPTAGNNLTITGPEPEDLAATTNSHLEVQLTATDSRGLTTTVTRDLRPRTVGLDFETQPSGLELRLAGTTFTAPTTITSWDGWSIPIAAPNQTDSLGRSWLFDAWSDGGAAAHSITTPSSAASYTASFRAIYPRPGGASPLRVPLVPAFKFCVSPNVRHVVPLDYPSCQPPDQQSTQLTTSSIGTGSAMARLTVLVGNSSTVEDEADVQITVFASDVRRRSDGADYAGKVLLRTTMRLTDTGNGPSVREPATVQDLVFSLPVDCVPTTDASRGSQCNLATTADTVIPGIAVEGRRSVLSTPDLKLMDAGFDGSISPPSGVCPPTCGSGDERVFLRQGLFAP